MINFFDHFSKVWPVWDLGTDYPGSHNEMPSLVAWVAWSPSALMACWMISTAWVNLGMISQGKGLGWLGNVFWSINTPISLRITYLILPGSHSTTGSMISPETGSWAFEILNIARVIAMEKNREASARCWPGQILYHIIAWIPGPWSTKRWKSTFSQTQTKIEWDQPLVL